MKIIQKGKTILSTREDISRYLMRITINLGKTYYKKKCHPNFQVDSVEDMEQTFDALARENSLFDFDDKYRVVDLWDLIEKSSARLPRRSKEYFMWRLYYGLDDNEIAVIMGVKRASLCVLKNRTLNHLRNEMKNAWGVTDVATNKELLEKLDKIDDEELAHMLALVAYRESQEELDQLIQSEEYTPPDEIQTRAFQEKFHKDSQRALHRSKSRVIRWACGIAAAAVFAFAVPISADNVTIFELVAQIFTDYSKISEPEGYTFLKPDDWTCEYYPTWIPSTFHYEKASILGSSQSIRFESPEGYIMFVYTTDWTSDYGPMEETTTNTDILTLHGQSIPVYTSQDGTTRTVYIRMENGTIIIDGKITSRQIEKIAQSITNL